MPAVLHLSNRGQCAVPLAPAQAPIKGSPGKYRLGFEFQINTIMCAHLKSKPDQVWLSFVHSSELPRHCPGHPED